jgi:group I intron endonuclease
MKNEIATSLNTKSGIYCISNTLDERIYIGSAVRLRERYRSHKCRLRKGNHNSIILQRFYDKHGADKLIFSLIELCEKDDLITREQYHLDTLKPAFNIRKEADRNTGIKRRPETIAQKSLSMKAWAQTTQGKAHYSKLAGMPKKGNTGNTHSAEIRAKISQNLNRAAISGCNNYLSKFTPQQVQEIRDFIPKKLGDMSALIAKFGVNKSTIQRIRAGKSYKN